MALTKFDVASSALVLIGANPVTSFDGAQTESIACKHLYQTTLDHWLSLYPWRFATKTTQLARIGSPTEPDTQWDAAYTLPSGIKALQAIRLNRFEADVPFDRYENTIRTDATESDVVWAVHTYEPPIAWWPGYFVTLIETGLAERLAVALAGKLDLKKDLLAEVKEAFSWAKNADARQQTSRKFRLTGRRSIMEARRA